MSVPRRQIGWSQKANLYYQISLQLDRLIKLKTGIAPTTTSTTTAPLFSGTVYWGEDSATACGEVLPITATGDGTTFCNTSTFTGSGFSVIGTEVVVISAGGQLKTVNHVSGDPFVTLNGGCDPCPPPVYTYVTQYDADSSVNACYNPTSTPNVYSADSVLIVGSVLFYNGNLTSPVIEGYYAIDGFIYHPVVDGVIETIEACYPDQGCAINWSTVNLNVDTYANGDAIPQVTDPIQWSNLTTGAWCYYNNDAANGPIYGKLYNWYAVNDVRGLAPTGYHIPSITELDTLVTCLGGYAIAGGSMKDVGSGLWTSPNTGATNSSGFTGLPGGGISFDFFYKSDSGFWWTSTINGATTANAFRLQFDSTTVLGGFSPSLGLERYIGLSVRVVKNVL